MIASPDAVTSRNGSTQRHPTRFLCELPSPVGEAAYVGSSNPTTRSLDGIDSNSISVDFRSRSLDGIGEKGYKDRLRIGVGTSGGLTRLKSLERGTASMQRRRTSLQCDSSHFLLGVGGVGGSKDASKVSSSEDGAMGFAESDIRRWSMQRRRSLQSNYSGFRIVSSVSSDAVRDSLCMIASTVHSEASRVEKESQSGLQEAASPATDSMRPEARGMLEKRSLNTRSGVRLPGMISNKQAQVIASDSDSGDDLNSRISDIENAKVAMLQTHLGTEKAKKTTQTHRYLRAQSSSGTQRGDAVPREHTHSDQNSGSTLDSWEQNGVPRCNDRTHSAYTGAEHTQTQLMRSQDPSYTVPDQNRFCIFGSQSASNTEPQGEMNSLARSALRVFGSHEISELNAKLQVHYGSDADAQVKGDDSDRKLLRCSGGLANIQLRNTSSSIRNISCADCLI